MSRQPHAPTFVAWAILEEDQGIAALNQYRGHTQQQQQQQQQATSIDMDHTIGADVDVLLNEDTLMGSGGGDGMMDHASIEDEEDEEDEFSYNDVTIATSGRSRTSIMSSSHLPLDSSSSSSSSSHHKQQQPTSTTMPDFASFDLTDDSGTSPASRKRLLLSNALERDPPLDFSTGTAITSTDVNNSMGPLGDIPRAPSPTTPAAEAFAMAQFRKARQLFSVGMMVDPQHGPLYHAYGNMELRRNNVTGARDVLMRGIAMNCEDVTSLYHAWGLLEIKDNRRTEAAGIFRRGIELGLKGNREVEHGVGFLLHSLGMLEMDGQRIEEAKRVFSTGVSLFPRHSQMLLGLALACGKLGQLGVARQHYRASVDADPSHAHAWQVRLT